MFMRENRPLLVFVVIRGLVPERSDSLDMENELSILHFHDQTRVFRYPTERY